MDLTGLHFMAQKLAALPAKTELLSQGPYRQFLPLGSQLGNVPGQLFRPNKIKPLSK